MGRTHELLMKVKNPWNASFGHDLQILAQLPLGKYFKRLNTFPPLPDLLFI